jgi:hypothetical protein
MRKVLPVSQHDPNNFLPSFAHIFGAYFIKRDYSSEDPRGSGLNLMDTKPEHELVVQRTCLSLCLSASLPLCLSIYISSAAVYTFPCTFPYQRIVGLLP